MTKESDQNLLDDSEEENINQPDCFVIMPISDRPPYEEGHFNIVYEHLIKPACKMAGFKSIRSDQIQKTHLIIKEILKSLLSADMAICDISGQNPNVLFELGIRQAFNLPVTLIRDSITPKIFDIDGLNCVNYDEKLRVDNIQTSVNIIAITMKNTYKSKENSLIEALSIKPAELPTERVLSPDMSIILESIKDIKMQLNSMNQWSQYSSLIDYVFLNKLSHDCENDDKYSSFLNYAYKDGSWNLDPNLLKKAIKRMRTVKEELPDKKGEEGNSE